MLSCHHGSPVGIYVSYSHFPGGTCTSGIIAWFPADGDTSGGILRMTKRVVMILAQAAAPVRHSNTSCFSWNLDG